MEQVDSVIQTLGLDKFNDCVVIKKLSTVSKIDGKYISLGFVLIAMLLLTLTNIGQFFLNLAVSFFYPVYMSFQAKEQENADQTKKWLVYWIIFGIFHALLAIVQLVVVVPSINLFSAAFFLTLFMPQTNGQDIVFEMALKPAFSFFEENVGKKLEMMKAEMEDSQIRAKRNE